MISNKQPQLHEYFVYSNYGTSGSVWLVTAKNKKSAINRIWEEKLEPYNKQLREENKDTRELCFSFSLYKKSQTMAVCIDDLHKKHGQIVELT